MKICCRKWLLLILSTLFSISLLAEEQKSKLRFAGVPAIGFDPDSGFGFGIIGSMYQDQEGYAPYKAELRLKAYLTTKGMNSHLLQYDLVRAFNLPLRLITRVGFYSTVAQNYCGRAIDARCDVNKAKEAAEGVAESYRNSFINRYYKNRMMSIFGDISSRWLLWQDEAKLELMANVRGIYYLNRDFKTKGPYPGSLFAKDFQNEKAEGYLSTVEIGLMFDKRDNEPAPTKGYWLESSIRGGSFIIGSAWDYFGANAAARFYFPLDSARKLVIASQTIADVMIGDLPYDAISRVGGSMALYDFTAIGGPYIGRGIKEQGYVGRIKFIEQAEFRYSFWSFMLLKQNFDLNLAVFGDVAMTAWDFSRFTKDMKTVYTGFGAGLRVYWNKTFVVRADLGVSPSEKFSPKFYLAVGNIF